jgi:hypothetical protein
MKTAIAMALLLALCSLPAIAGFHDDGANVLLLWMGGGFRSKKFPITWKYNESHENIRQDFVRELIDHAHAKGIRVLLGFTPFGYDGANQYPLEHPELKAVQKNGKPVDAFGIHAWGYNLCPSKEESQRFMLKYVREMLFDFYPNADGLMIESSDYAVCHCPDCTGRFFEREFRFVSQISRDVWERKPDATVIVYPHYFSGAAVPGLDVKSATKPFDPRWTLFFTPHSTRLDPALLKQARTSLYWSEAPALGGPDAIRQGAQTARRFGFTGYVPSLEAYSYVATRPEEGQSYLVGKRQVPLGFGWVEPGRLPYGELPLRINRFAYREFSRDPDLAMDEFKARLGRDLFGYAATPERIADALEIQRLFAMERSWSQASPLACPDRVRAMKAAGQLTPEKQAAYRQALDRAAAIAARSKDADAPAVKEMHRIASWLLAQWPAENRALLVGEKTLKVRLSWGHRSPRDTPFYVECLAAQAKIADVSATGMKDGEGPSTGPWETRAGGGPRARAPQRPDGRRRVGIQPGLYLCCAGSPGSGARPRRPSARRRVPGGRPRLPRLRAPGLREGLCAVAPRRDAGPYLDALCPVRGHRRSSPCRAVVSDGSGLGGAAPGAAESPAPRGPPDGLSAPGPRGQPVPERLGDGQRARL